MCLEYHQNEVFTILLFTSIEACMCDSCASVTKYDRKITAPSTLSDIKNIHANANSNQAYSTLAQSPGQDTGIENISEEQNLLEETAQEESTENDYSDLLTTVNSFHILLV